MTDESRSGTSERLIAADELAGLLGVAERDVLEWIQAGHIPVEVSGDGQPRARISQEWSESSSGAVSQGVTVTSYSHHVPAELLTAAKARTSREQRQREIEAMDLTGIDLDVVTNALARSLTAVAPDGLDVAVVGPGALDVLDVAAGLSFDPSAPAAARVCVTALAALERAQELFAEETTEPWPRIGRGQLPEPGAELDGDHIRLFYGPSDRPVLSLEPLSLTDALRD